MHDQRHARRHPAATRARRSLLAPLSAAALLAALAGCGGHGKYTSEGLNLAQARMAQMRAAQEWDMARQSYLAGDLDKALAAIDNSIAIKEDVVKSHVLRGRILLEKGDLEGAITSLERAEALAALPEQQGTDKQHAVDAQYFQGIVFERFAQKERALEHYRKAADLDPANPQYAVAAAEMMMDLGRLDEAERYLTERRASFEHNAGVRQTLGHIAMMKDDHARAVTMFNEARLLAPDDAAILEDLVRAQVAAGQFAEAEYNIARLLEAPGNAERRDLRHIRARCLAAVDRPVEARDILIALTNEPEGAKDVQTWIELGQVAYILGDFHRVRQAASRAIALAPDRPEGYTLRALWERRQGNLRAALEQAQRAVAKAPDDPNPLVVRAMILREMGRDREARASLSAAARLDPAFASVSEDATIR